MTQQKQFLDVIDCALAKSRFEAAITLQAIGEEIVPLNQALGRVLSQDVTAKVNVPSFDRSNLDGYAVKASDTVGAEEYSPVYINLVDEKITAGGVPKNEITEGFATLIATGGMVPRGADAIVMVEHTDQSDDKVMITKPVSPGAGIAFAGTDVSQGETILYQGDLLTSRETGILAALGEAKVYVWKRPKVAIISTGNEIISPAEAMLPGFVFDSNARIIADAVRELGGEPVELGIVNDNLAALQEKIDDALTVADIVLLSGGTSKGQGDLSYQAVYQLKNPGVIVHGVALKPGKPICLAATQGKPVVVLPGFPTSAIFTFHEFIAPVIRQLAGFQPSSQTIEKAELAVSVNSEIGRTEFLLVRLLNNPQAKNAHQQSRFTAYPIGKGSGSVTTFSHADGFVRIDRHVERVEANTQVDVQLISKETKPADLVIMGSHCAGLDLMISLLKKKGIQTRFMSVGSSAGLMAVKRQQCDIAGIHLFNSEKEVYNTPYLTDKLTLIKGYRRQQGLIFRKGDIRFQSWDVTKIFEQVKNDPSCLMINRNTGSGTRVLIEQLLDGEKPEGYFIQTSNHRAVMAAVQQGRADWGVAIEAVVDDPAIDFLPLQEEQYDFVVSHENLQKEAVQVFINLLKDKQVQELLITMKIDVGSEIGVVEE